MVVKLSLVTGGSHIVGTNGGLLFSSDSSYVSSLEVGGLLKSSTVKTTHIRAIRKQILLLMQMRTYGGGLGMGNTPCRRICGVCGICTFAEA